MNSCADCSTYTLSRGASSPLEYFCIVKIKILNWLVAERVGFEPTVPFSITGFQDQLLKPLGHLSVNMSRCDPTHDIVSYGKGNVKTFFAFFQKLC